MRFPRLPGLLAGAIFAARAAVAEPSVEQMQRGEKLYAEKCLMCHQPAGQGAPPVFPPLAGSDWVTGDRVRLVKVLAEGLAGTIRVRGESFSGAMPAQMLDDAQAADVLTFIGNRWGNQVAPFTAGEVEKARRQSRFKTYAELVRAAAYRPLPAAPPGCELREVAQCPEFLVRMASDGKGRRVYLLAQAGHVYSLEPASGALTRELAAEAYLDAAWGDYVTLGLAIGPDGRLWLTSNQKLTRDVPHLTAETVIWRSREPAGAGPLQLEPWFVHRYPQGVGGMNHGISHLAFGPDGWLYVSSGSRTDGGEVSRPPQYAEVGEVESTAAVWRLDPRAAQPQLEVFARGIRNAYGFAWDAAGRLFTFSNGPDYDAGEEMDLIEAGSHHGFPYQFENWPARAGHPYPHTPAAPAGLTFSHPVENVGPDGGFRDGQPCRTFTPHSCPGGTIWCGAEFPPVFRDAFLMPRYGNLLAKPEDSGFDLLAVRPRRRADGSWQAEVRTVLAPLARPIDVHALPGGRVLILEYTRPTNFKDRVGWLPGRILELSPVR